MPSGDRPQWFDQVKYTSAQDTPFLQISPEAASNAFAEYDSRLERADVITLEESMTDPEYLGTMKDTLKKLQDVWRKSGLEQDAINAQSVWFMRGAALVFEATSEMDQVHPMARKIMDLSLKTDTLQGFGVILPNARDSLSNAYRELTSTQATDPFVNQLITRHIPPAGALAIGISAGMQLRTISLGKPPTVGTA